MKKTLLMAAIVLLGFVAQAQNEKTLTDIGTFYLRNTGAMVDKNKDVDGYYFYYVMDKLKKGQREFAIQILDKNLTEVAKKTYVDDKNTTLIESSFNNQNILFLMANFDKKKMTLLTFDRQANQTSKVDMPLSSKEARYYQGMIQYGMMPPALFAVDNKGFLFSKLSDNDKMGYSLKYYSSEGGKGWEFNSPADSDEVVSISPLEVNEKVVVALEMARPGALSRKISTRIKVIDINTGKLLFEREYNKNAKPRFINNAFLNGDNTIVFMGEYFKEGDNVLDDKSIGLFTEVIDFSGKTLSENFSSWDGDVSKVMKVKNGKVSDKGYVFFHDIIKTGNQHYYAIGEYFRKTANAGGIAANILSRGASTAGNTQLTITDAVVFHFDANFKLVSVQDFDKGTSRVSNLADFGSPQLNAHITKVMGGFDYVYTQRDPANDRFYASFIDYERLKGESNKFAFKSIIYDDGQLSQDKIYLNSKSKEFKVLPGKVGYVLLMEYNKKEKSISLHLEKLNIK
ncbi:MAG TPA: DUF6770 family protein [Flavobacterium sp.]|nr:DUF6770 family protein [Flavobacterium sp.]